MEFVTKEHSKDEICSLLHPLIRTWLEGKFETLTPPQSMAIPHIHGKENILVSSPTGSGKTITAFLSIINELYNKQMRGTLEDRIYCVYVSPLKALANDINKNLKTPLKEITDLANEAAGELGPAPKIRVAVRSGDTSSYERSRMVKKPPHIFITTPESLALVLSTPKFREKFADVRYLIIDEIHDISDSKRGVLLSLTVERLQQYVAGKLTRIGLSATQAPIEEIGKFLVGFEKKEDGNWGTRPLKIVEVQKRKLLDIKVLSPVENMNKFNYEVINTKLQDLLPSLIKSHNSTIIFTNTRSSTETIVHSLKSRGLENVAAHHGSLSKEVRIDVENKLKTGALKAVVTSTSLELGIDVGYVDLVCQIGSPKTVAKALQRIGRAGHSMVAISKGRVLVYEKDDLVECAVLSRFARDGKIDRIFILKNSLDVLAQTILGLSLEKKNNVDDAYEIVKASYCYHELTREKFVRVLKYISGSEIEGIYGKLWYDPKTDTFGKKKGSRLIYYTNVGTIPPESNYYVKMVGTGYPIGQLSEKFVENLRQGDIFILGGKTYQFVKTSGMEIFVKDAFGRKPTVPSWTGELLPRSYDLSLGIGAFRRKVQRYLLQRDGQPENPVVNVCLDPEEEGEGSDTNAEVSDFCQELMMEYSLDLGSVNTILGYIGEQLKFHGALPTDRHVVIEGYIDPKGLYNIIFHSPFGRRTNDALSRTYAYVLSNKYDINVRTSLTDDNFLLTLERSIPLEELPGLLKEEELEDTLRKAVKGTELFNQRFRHCATRGLMILRSYKGKEISIERQQVKTTKIIRSVEGMDDFPIVEETYNEILNDAMNITTAKEVLGRMNSGEITTSTVPYNSVPSPFSHNIILMGVSDIVLMEDRSSLLRELHAKVLEQALDKGTVEARFKPSLVKAHFKSKLPEINRKEDILNVIREMGGLRLFVHKGDYIAHFSELPDPLLRLWALEYICHHSLVDVKARDHIWILREDYPDMANIYAKNIKLSPEEKKYFQEIKEFTKRFWSYKKKCQKFCSCNTHSPILHNRQKLEENKTVLALRKEVAKLRKEGEKLFGKGKQKLLDKLHGAYMVYGTMVMDSFEIRNVRVMIEDIWSEDNGETLLRKNADKLFGSLDKHCTKVFLAPDDKLVGAEIPFEESLNRIISRHLKFKAPAIVEELALELRIAKNLIYEGLESLEKRNVLTSGNYLPNLPPRQYLYIEDLLNLEAKTKGKYEIIQEEQATQYLYNNHFHRDGFESMEDMLRFFGTVSSRFDLYSHYPGFTLEEWVSKRKVNEIMTGRFLGGKVSNTIPEYLEHYLPIYQLEKPDEFQERVLEVLEKKPSSISTLIHKLGAERNQVKGGLSFLDRNLYIQRAFIETERIANDYATIPRLIGKEVEEKDEDQAEGGTEESVEAKRAKKRARNQLEAMKRLILIYLGANAPASFQILRRMLRIYRREITLALDSLEKEGKIQQVYVIGQTKELRYILSGQLDGIKETEMVENKTRIVSLTDPYVYRFISEIRMRYGDGWFYPVIRNKRVVGIVNAWKRSDSFEIRSVDVFEEMEQNEEFVNEFVDALEEFFRFHQILGTTILKVTSLFKKEIKDLNPGIQKVFRERGFRRIHSWFVKGDILGRSYEQRDLVNYIMYRQYFIWPEMVATQDKFSDDKLIPLLKDKTLDKSMKRILAVIPPSRKVSRAEILSLVGLEQELLDSALKDLEDMGYLARTGQAFSRRERVTTISKEEAEKELVKNRLREFGILNIANLHKYLRANFTLRRIKEVLETLIREEEVDQGYFVKGDEKLYYILKGEERQILRKTFRSNAVVNPEARLYRALAPIISMTFPMKNPGLIFLRGKICGAFLINEDKSTTKTLHIDLYDEGQEVLQDHFRGKKLIFNEIELGK